MVIHPHEAKRIILSVSPSQLDASWHKAGHKETITFRSLAAMAQQKIQEEPYYCWLIYTEASEKTAQYLRQHFSTCIEFGDLPRVNSAENAQEIFELILRVASDPINTGQTVICDCTGGTKTMSIAMALACNYHALTSESQTRLMLTYIPRDRDNDEILFHEVVRDEQRRYVDQQERIGRLRYLAQYASILAHEIKNPLNLIGTALYLLRSETFSDDAKIQLDKIEKAFKEIDKVVGGIQQAVRKESDTLSLSPIRLTEVVRLLQGRTEKLYPNLILNVSGDISETQLRITEEKLYSIFANLIDNAAHATAGTGTVSLDFRKHENRLHIRVEDNGPGIPAELQANLFKPLYHGKNSSGTGMGLSIVRAFIVEEGGSITLDSAYKQGARFLIDLPIDKNGEA
jgi:signal transduction histidine kinase